MRLLDAESIVWMEAQRALPTSAVVEPEYIQALMGHQLTAVQDPSRQRAVWGPRRSGKTELSRVGLYRAVQYPQLVCDKWKERGVPPIARYWAPTRDRARELMWRPLIRFADEWGIDIDPHETSLTIRLQNGGEIRLVGADGDQEAQKKRGDPTVYEEVDEAQYFKPGLLETICDEVIGPSLMDFVGAITVKGTPGPVFEGFWFDLSGPNISGLTDRTLARRAGWSRHYFDVYDNVHLPHAREEIEKARIAKGWSLDNPRYLRESRGQWVYDPNALYYDWDRARNTYDGNLPSLPHGRVWNYSIGLDLGGGRRKVPQGRRDPKSKNAARPTLGTMAMTAWAWSDGDPYLYEVFSRKGFDSLAQVAEQDRELQKRFGSVWFRRADCGALGGVIMDEFCERFGIYYESAEKTEKYAAVQVMNDAFRAGAIKTIAGSVLSEEYATLPKDSEDPLEADPNFDDHNSDAGLYAFRPIKFTFQPPQEKPSGQQAFQQAEDEHEQREAEGRHYQDPDDVWSGWESDAA